MHARKKNVQMTINLLLHKFNLGGGGIHSVLTFLEITFSLKPLGVRLVEVGAFPQLEDLVGEDGSERRVLGERESVSEFFEEVHGGGGARLSPRCVLQRC